MARIGSHGGSSGRLLIAQQHRILARKRLEILGQLIMRQNDPAVTIKQHTTVLYGVEPAIFSNPCIGRCARAWLIKLLGLRFENRSQFHGGFVDAGSHVLLALRGRGPDALPDSRQAVRLLQRILLTVHVPEVVIGAMIPVLDHLARLRLVA